MNQEHVHGIADLHARTDQANELDFPLTSLPEPTQQESTCIRFETPRNRQTQTQSAIVASPITQLQTCRRTLAERLEQQTATSEILRLISQSQCDVQPVFEAIAANAMKLCHS
jgi:hypothetical protein